MPALPRNMPELKLLWKHRMAGECDAGIAAVGPVVVAADHDDGHDYYRCLDAERGTEVWTRTFPNAREMDYGAGPRATPLVERDKVYVLSAFGELYCFDLKTGKTIWQLDFGKEFGVAQSAEMGLLQFAADRPGEADRQPRRQSGPGGAGSRDGQGALERRGRRAELRQLHQRRLRRRRAGGRPRRCRRWAAGT